MHSTNNVHNLLQRSISSFLSNFSRSILSSVHLYIQFIPFPIRFHRLLHFPNENFCTILRDITGDTKSKAITKSNETTINVSPHVSTKSLIYITINWDAKPSTVILASRPVSHPTKNVNEDS